MNLIKEVYSDDISPEVIKEYEEYIEMGWIRPFNILDCYKIEDDPCPVWVENKLTEEDLLFEIERAKRRWEILHQFKRDPVPLEEFGRFWESEDK